ncbi:MAG: hypothetical protein AB7S78_13070 [Candidatus Omnitrophota bacterium]
MRLNIKILIISIVTGTAFVFFVRSNLLQKVPGFQCESFGCSGLGVVYFVLGLMIIPLIFGAAGFIFTAEDRSKRALSALGISFGVMLCSLLVIHFWHRMEVKRAIEEETQNMRELYQRLGIPEDFASRELYLPEK